MHYDFICRFVCHIIYFPYDFAVWNTLDFHRVSVEPWDTNGLEEIKKQAEIEIAKKIAEEKKIKNPIFVVMFLFQELNDDGKYVASWGSSIGIDQDFVLKEAYARCGCERYRNLVLNVKRHE